MPAPAAANRHVRSQRPGQAELDGRRAATEVRMIFEMRKCRRLTSCSGGRGGVLRHLPAASKPPSAKSGTRIVGSLRPRLRDGVIEVHIGGARCCGVTVQATPGKVRIMTRIVACRQQVYSRSDGSGPIKAKADHLLLCLLPSILGAPQPIPHQCPRRRREAHLPFLRASEPRWGWRKIRPADIPPLRWRR